jgi:hypothetical protein
MAARLLAAHGHRLGGLSDEGTRQGAARHKEKVAVLWAANRCDGAYRRAKAVDSRWDEPTTFGSGLTSGCELNSDDLRKQRKGSTAVTTWRCDGQHGTAVAGTSERRWCSYPGGGGRANKAKQRPNRAVRTGHHGPDSRHFYGARVMAGRAPPSPANHDVARSGFSEFTINPNFVSRPRK